MRSQTGPSLPPASLVPGFVVAGILAVLRYRRTARLIAVLTVVQLLVLSTAPVYARPVAEMVLAMAISLAVVAVAAVFLAVRTNFDPALGPPTFDQLLDLIDPADRSRLMARQAQAYQRMLLAGIRYGLASGLGGQDLVPAQKDYIRSHVQGFEDALHADLAAGWRQRAHLDFRNRREELMNERIIIMRNNDQ